MDNAHPSRNGTIQLIVAVILTKTVILYCSYLYPYMKEFCAGSLVHGMMSSFYTVWCEICGIQCTYSGTLTNYFWFVFPSLHNRHYCFAFFRREGESKVSEKCQKCTKREDVMPPCLPPFVYGSLHALHSCQCLARIACYAGYVFPSTWKMITGNWQ